MTTEELSDAPACKGKLQIAEHRMVEIGKCWHKVGGANYQYIESGCEDCGVTARRTAIYACGTREKAVRPTPENCLALAWKAQRTTTAA